MTQPRIQYRRRARTVCMSHDDNVWFTDILREAISPLALLLIDEDEKRIEPIDTLAGQNNFIAITNPKGRGATLKQLQAALRRSAGSLSEPFRSVLPSGAAVYLPHEKVYSVPTRWDGGGSTVKIFDESPLHFTYRRDDDVAEAFANRFMRLMDKHLVHQFAVVDSETGQVVQEVLSRAALWVGPDVVKSCRQARDCFICSVYSEGETMHCYAPLPSESGRQDKPRARRRT